MHCHGYVWTARGREAKNAEEKSGAKEDEDDFKGESKAASPSSARADPSPSAEAKLRGRPLIQAVCAYCFEDENFQEVSSRVYFLVTTYLGYS